MMLSDKILYSLRQSVLARQFKTIRNVADNHSRTFCRIKVIMCIQLSGSLIFNKILRVYSFPNIVDNAYVQSFNIADNNLTI